MFVHALHLLYPIERGEAELGGGFVRAAQRWSPSLVADVASKARLIWSHFPGRGIHKFKQQGALGTLTVPALSIQIGTSAGNKGIY